MNAALCLCRGYALHAMNSAFITELAKNRFTRNAEYRFLASAELRWTRFQVFGFQACGFRVTVVHPVKVRGENRRFASASSRPNFHNGVAVFIFIRWQQGNLNLTLQFRHALFELRDL